MSKTYEISGATIVVASCLDELAGYVDPDAACIAISGWIEQFNAHQGATGTMLPQSPAVLRAKMASGFGVVLLQRQNEGRHTAIAFCGLSSDPVGEPLPVGVYEIGGLIKAPEAAAIRGLGVVATHAALLLPVAREATTVYAYTNPSSQHVFTVDCERSYSVGATVMTEDELARRPYLVPYAGDVLVDLTPIRDGMEVAK